MEIQVYNVEKFLDEDVIKKISVGTISIQKK